MASMQTLCRTRCARPGRQAGCLVGPRGVGRAQRQPVRVHAAQVQAERATTSYEDVWGHFAAKVQGEWEGVTVTFDDGGSPQPLPDRYVPDAFRDWGVELWDWQSQCSTVIVEGAGAPSGRVLKNIAKRMMPTVGCEADAIAYVEEAQDVWQADGGSEVKPVSRGGGYVAAPAQLPSDSNKVKVEACLAGPEGGQRLRVVVTLMQHWESKQWAARFVDVSREAYEGPFNGGAELCGCAGGNKPFAKEAAPAPEQLRGSWRQVEALAYHRTEGKGFKLTDGDEAGGSSTASSSDLDGAIVVPPGVWVACTAAGQDVRLEVGALRGAAERDVAVCSYQGGQLRQVVLSRDVRA